MLPLQFTQRMQEMLKEEYPLFLESYEKQNYQSLRMNPLKGSREEFLKKAPFSLKPVVWAEDGFYYDSKDQPGKHPFHEAGVYYIQEASAMAPVTYLAPCPGEQVLDLCAAPGGKSTQIGAAMKGEGILVCNEIHPARAKILSENVERMGIKNALVTNETPDRLAEYFPEYFDRILVDAPCSGEGMFRKNEEACREWSPENVRMCAARQDDILDAAARMLRCGGRLVYSTCTFAPEEDEGSIRRFLLRHPDFEIADAVKYPGMEGGQEEWLSAESGRPLVSEGGRQDSAAGQGKADAAAEESGGPAADAESAGTGLSELAKTIRLWPHKLAGEGHYLAVLTRRGSVPEGYRGRSLLGIQKGIPEKEYKGFTAFAKENLSVSLKGTFFSFGEQLYLAPENMPALRGLKVLRPGLHLGALKKDRFEPSHALALALRADQVKRTVDLTADGAEAKAWIGGLTLNREGEKGWYLVTVDGYSLGWGKLAGGILKNHYPKGLRKNL